MTGGISTFSPFGEKSEGMESETNSGEGQSPKPVAPEVIKPKKSENVSPELTPEKKDNQEVDVEEIKKQLETIGGGVDRLKEQRDQEAEKREKAEAKVSELAEKFRKQEEEFADQMSGVQEQIQGIIAKHHQSGDANSKKEKPAGELPVESPFGK